MDSCNKTQLVFGMQSLIRDWPISFEDIFSFVLLRHINIKFQKNQHET
jgi:hypothetical protein